MVARAQMVTHRDKCAVGVASQLPRPLYDRLEAHCKKLGVLKAHFIRSLIERELPADNVSKNGP